MILVVRGYSSGTVKHFADNISKAFTHRHNLGDEPLISQMTLLTESTDTQ